MALRESAQRSIGRRPREAHSRHEPMRKKDPVLVRSEFAKDLRWLASHHERVREIIDEQALPGRLADMGQLAASTFLTAFAEFEGFVSNLFLAYLNRDFSAYQGWREAAVQQSVRSRFDDWTADRTEVRRESNPTVREVRDLLDPSGRNLTFKTAGQMLARADDWLVSKHKARIHSLDQHDLRLIDTAKAIRNYFAHGSDSAYSEMNDALSTVDQGPPNRGLGRRTSKVTDVGKFLKKVSEGETVCSRFLDRMVAISKKM